MISKTVQSLKTIMESNLDLERPQAKSPPEKKKELELDSIKPPGARVYEIILRQMKSMHWR